MNKYRSFVFYGRSGTGKTSIALTFPGKVLLLDIKDRGADSVSDVAPEDGMGMDVERWEDIEMVYYYLLKNPKEYRTVVLDTMSQLQELCVEYILRKKKKSTKNAGNWGVITRKEWGEVASLMKEWIIFYRDLNQVGITVVFIAQDRTTNGSDDDDDSESILTPSVGPRLSPAIASHLNAAVSLVGNTFVRERNKVKEVNGRKKEYKETQYCLRIGPNPVYVTKTRKPKHIQVPDVIVDADYETIISKLKGE